MTYKQAAQDALAVQDACNLSGVVKSFHEIVTNVLWPEARKDGHGTDWVNQHPIVYLFLYKLMALNGHEPISDWETYNGMERAVNGIIQAQEIVEIVDELQVEGR